MLNIVLYQPEIPPNTGNIIRLCHNGGFHLHLIKPLGFELDEPRLRRAGLDYLEWKNLALYESWPDYLERHGDARRFALSTKSSRSYSDVEYEPGDHLVFGPETRGLPDAVRQSFSEDRQLRIPMRDGSRSLNLSNAVALVSYEAWRQCGFGGAS